jgi:ferredoxin-NADP reductase/MOSC domain-containing protein YiiM/ferredoxin
MTVPELLAICVGLPKEVAWRGNTVRTGVWKQAVDGPRMVRHLNIDGDGQGDLLGHGGEQRAVLVYQMDSYRYWQRILGREDFVYGQFGENFTVDGLADDEVCVGDRYRIGEAVFEVTQPRVTCYRVGIRLNEPAMPALMVSHRRPGFYLRVLVEGPVQAGDQITLLARGPEAMTVAEMDALLYLPGHAPRQLARALRIPALSPGWQTSLQEMLDQAGAGGGGGNVGLSEAARNPPPAWPGFRALQVTRKASETPSVTSLWLASEDGADLPPAQAGQFVAVRLRPDREGPPIIRSYSLSGQPGAPHYRISVKREPGGVASAYLDQHLQSGHTLDAAAPRGTFTLRAGDSPLILASAGIGVTPVLAMLYSLVAENTGREVWWLHGTRNRAEHAFAEEAQALLGRLANGHSHVCYSQPDPADRPGPWYTAPGRLSAEVVAELGIPSHADAYLCGPDAFMAQFGAGLVGLGFGPSRIHTETFGTIAAITPGIETRPDGPAHPPAGPPGPGPAVSFGRSSLSVNWNPDYGALLDLAEECNVPTRWSCRTGVCHTCETPLLSGSVGYDPEPVEHPADGNVLLCCSHPTADVVLDL